MAKRLEGYENVHGREWGRGLRPYLLLPKIICVSTLVGSLICLLVLVFLRSPPTDVAEWRAESALISRTYRFVFLPALLGSLALGILLTLMHFKVLIRMRWLQVKLVLIVGCVPTLHLFMYRQSSALKATLADPANLPAAAGHRAMLLAGTLATLAFVLVLMFLGRIKPRLGQAFGRTFGGVNPIKAEG